MTQVAGGATSAYTVGYLSAKPHAAAYLNGNQRYWYDGNGNMTRRVEVVSGQRVTYTQGWDVENRLIAITNTLGQVTTYTYNASGQRVKRVDASGTLVTLGAHYEQLRVGAAVTNTSYYFFGDRRVAMRQTNMGTGVSTVYWLHGDHLGSASLATTSSGTPVPNSVTRYKPFGEIRYPTSGSSSLLTDRTFTGQRSEQANLVGSLMDYGARFYSPLLGRFLSADSIVPQPGDPQSLNRYTYVLNKPLNHTDPSGHCFDDVCGIGGGTGPTTPPSLPTPTPIPDPVYPSLDLIDWPELLNIPAGQWINIPSLPPIIRPTSDSNLSNYGIDADTFMGRLTWFPRNPTLAYHTGLIAFSVDIASEGISGLWMLFSGGLGLVTAEGFGVGYLAGAEAYQVFNGIENVFGYASFALTSISDFSSGNMTIYRRENGYQLRISSGASLAGVTAVMGTAGGTGSDPTLDTLWNSLVLAHDEGIIPRFRIVIQTLDVSLPRVYIELVD